MTWQDISTDPKDGTEVLIRTCEGLLSCCWDDFAQEWLAGWIGVALLNGDATHWQHLPEPPHTLSPSPFPDLTSEGQS